MSRIAIGLCVGVLTVFSAYFLSPLGSVPSQAETVAAVSDKLPSGDIVLDASRIDLISAENTEEPVRASIQVPVAKDYPKVPTWSERVQEIFSVKSVECHSNTRFSCKALEEKLRLNRALSLWQFAKDELSNLSLGKLTPRDDEGFSRPQESSLARDVLMENPWIEDAQVEVSYFKRSAQITIREAVPWFVTELRRANWIVSRKGALLQEVSSLNDPTLLVEVSQLPRVRGIEARGAGAVSREAERIKLVTEFLSAIVSSGGLPFEAESYELLEDDSIAISALSIRLPTVFIRPEEKEDTNSKLALLKQVLEDARLRGEQLQRVDLRFRGRAVVVREPLPPDSPLSKSGKLG